MGSGDINPWKHVIDVPYPIWLMMAGFAFLFGAGPQVFFPEMRADKFTATEGNELERRLAKEDSRLESRIFVMEASLREVREKVVGLPPDYLLTDVEVLKVEVSHIKTGLERIDARTQHIIELMEQHISVQLQQHKK